MEPTDAVPESSVDPVLPVADERPAGVTSAQLSPAGVSVEVTVREVLDAALAHNGVSPWVAVTVSAPVAGLRVEAELVVGNAAVATWSADLSTGTASRQRLAWPIDLALFQELPAPTQALVRVVALTGAERAGAELPILLLPVDRWWDQGIPESLAAQVRPDDPVVARLLARTVEILADRTGSPALDGDEAGPDRVHATVDAAFAALTELDLHPDPEPDPGPGRRIREPGRVLADKRAGDLDVAVLFAGVLVRAGLRPVLVVTDDHVLTGWLTERGQLPMMVLTEPGGIVTLADSPLFDAAETTAVLAGPGRLPFETARHAARARWADGLPQVRHLLDVRAAHRVVRPLGTSPAAPGRPDAPRFDAAPSAVGRTTTPGASAVPGRVDRWRRSLLDMTYLNPLLKLKTASVVPVHVPAGALGSLEDLVSAGTPLKVAPHDGLAEIHLARGARTAADIDPAVLHQQLVADHRLFVALPEATHKARLTRVARAAKRSAEETGTNSLYLTLGTLHWQERGGREGRAPLFLLPVQLSGGRGSTPFQLTLDETRDLQPNHCLVEKLRSSWGLVIPALTAPVSDEHGLDVPAVLAAVRSALLQHEALSFQVAETAYLATLQFSTLEQWRDLTDHWQAFEQNRAVGHLIHSPGSRFTDEIEAPAPDPVAEATAYLPIAADGSQLEAIRWAAAGRTFILEGPPGTGKSQTITNLIAHAVAQGKSVLFVAEKQAALDVVRRRLDAVGLGGFSLDLHGRNQTVTAVREQLTAALDAPVEGSAGWDAGRAGYRSQVENLARYPRQLHDPGPAGLSAWQARQIGLELQDAGVVQPADVPVAAVSGGHDPEQMYTAAADLRAAVDDLAAPPGASPWRWAGAVDPATLDRNRLVAALDRLVSADRAITDPGLRTLTDAADSPARFDTVARWCDSRAAGFGRPTAEAGALVTPEWNAQADRLLAAVETFGTTQGPRLGPFRPAVLAFDLDGLIGRSAAVDRKWFGRKRRRRELLAELSGVLTTPEPFPLPELTARLRGLAALRDQARPLVDEIHGLPGVVVPLTWNALAEQDRSVLAGAVHGLRAAATLRTAAGAQRVGLTDRLTTAGAIPVDGGTAALVRDLGRAWSDLAAQVGATPDSVAAWTAGTTRGEATAAALPAWTADAAGGAFIALGRWGRLRSAADRLTGPGLGGVADRVRTGAEPVADLELRVRAGVARAVLTERLQATGLVGFDDAERGHAVERFLATGADLRTRMEHELPRLIVEGRGVDPRSRVGQVAELRQQLGRRRGGLTVRQLLHRFGPLITRITPCLLMSPGSVARFLPADLDVDIVVFDEASQIRVPEAIGAMGRGKAVVVVGDSQQMPPTSVFATTGGDDQDEEAVGDDALPVPVDLESILSEGVESGLPRLWLSWHYRSRDEALIAFSNQHYYDGKLSSFPGPPAADRTAALSLRRVDGHWEGGARGARVNRAEAAAIVAEIRQRLADDTARSIGVVTFNTQQRDLILDLLEEQRSGDQALDRAMEADEEPLFVKNLENVQGDERDVILFSLAFAADDRGKVPLNWGPLTRAGGQRRLNVAVTRAKQAVVVFCSFEPHQLDLTNSTAVGLAHLKDYLLLARSGPEPAESARTRARDRHLDQVAAALAAAGLEVRTRVGLSDFTVDVAVRAADDHGWLAVLLDGPTWAARSTVGDRDGLPGAVLTGAMGWPAVTRVWLPTWLRDPAAVVAGVVARAQSLAPGAVDPPEPEPEPEPGPAAPAGPPVPGVVEDGEPGRRTAEPGRLEFQPASAEPRHDLAVLDGPTATTALTQEIRLVLETEGPMVTDRLVDVVGDRFAVTRMTAGRREQILDGIDPQWLVTEPNGDRVAQLPGTVDDGGFRVPGSGGRRELDEIPYRELRNALVQLVRGAHGVEVDELLRETARTFGFGRLGGSARQRLDGVLEAAIGEGLVVRDGELIQAAGTENR